MRAKRQCSNAIGGSTEEAVEPKFQQRFFMHRGVEVEERFYETWDQRTPMKLLWTLKPFNRTVLFIKGRKPQRNPCFSVGMQSADSLDEARIKVQELFEAYHFPVPAGEVRPELLELEEVGA